MRNIVGAGNRIEDVFIEQRTIDNEINKEYSEIDTELSGEKSWILNFQMD